MLGRRHKRARWLGWLSRMGDILWRDGCVALHMGNKHYIHAPYTGDVVKIATGINYFTCAVQCYSLVGVVVRLLVLLWTERGASIP